MYLSSRGYQGSGTLKENPIVYLASSGYPGLGTLKENSIKVQVYYSNSVHNLKIVQVIRHLG